ncbi:uncharacterized protein [Panulirus ornatus]
MRYTCDDSESNSSEFGSEDEEVECGLYAQLYFEPHPDVAVNTTSKGLAEIQSEANIFHKISQKEVNKRFSFNINEKNETGFTKEFNKKGSQNHTSAYSDLEKGTDCSSRTSLRVFDGGTSALNDANKEINRNCAQKLKLCQSPSTLSEEYITSNEAHTPQTRKREILSSTCSEVNISGSIPLDGLYCNNLLTDDEIEEDASSSLTILDKDKLGQKKGDQTQNNSKNRKRENGADSSEDEQDSRCDGLVCTVSKDTKLDESNKCILKDISDCDSEVYIDVPLSPKQQETITLDSSSDSVPVLTEKGKMSPTNETELKKKSSALLAKRTHTGSPKTGSKIYESLKKTSISMMKEHKKKKRKFGADVDTRFKPHVGTDTESDTDSDMDIFLIKGKALTINIDKQLSLMAEKFTKGDTCGIGRNVRGFGKNQGESKTRPSFDFTVGRPDTRKQPTCDHWTQEMANFYDSDVSDDLEIQAIHKQQTNKRAQWQIIKEDYPTPHKRRRYFGVEDRCTLCRQYGHQQNDCDRVPRCHLCSGTDHRRRQDCPQNCCFRCGGLTHWFCQDTTASVICNLCGYHGHRSERCPDLWRRFHLTTSGLIACTPLETTSRPLKERFCYNCAQRGHFGHDCPTKHEHHLYQQVPQSIFSYSSPVLLVNGSFNVNTEGTQNKNPDIQLIPVKNNEIGKIIGPKGLIIKEIQRFSGAVMRIVTNNGQSKVMMLGNSEAKSAAQDIVEILLRRKSVEGYEEFFKQLSRIRKGFSFSIIGSLDTFSKENNQDLNLKTNDMRMPPDTFSKENNSSADNQIASSDWSFKFLNKLGRKKTTVIKNLRRNIRRLDLYQETINDSVSKLKTYQKKLKRYHLGISETRIAKKNLRRVARVVIGRERYGPGKYIYEHLHKLELDIQLSQKNHKVPETVCQNIMHTLAQVYDPPLEKLDEILKFAKQYRNSCLKSLKNTETVNQNDGTESKKGTKKNWQASNLQEKNIAQNEDIISEDMKATQKEKGNKLQLEKDVKKILLQKDNTRKTSKETKKKATKNTRKTGKETKNTRKTGKETKNTRKTGKETKNTRKTGRETKKMETKNKVKQQCKLCKKIRKQCSKCLKQKLLKDSGSNILHPHKQVDASQLKKVNKAETSKIGENKDYEK